MQWQLFFLVRSVARIFQQPCADGCCSARADMAGTSKNNRSAYTVLTDRPIRLSCDPSTTWQKRNLHPRRQQCHLGLSLSSCFSCSACLRLPSFLFCFSCPSWSLPHRLICLRLRFAFLVLGSCFLLFRRLLVCIFHLCFLWSCSAVFFIAFSVSVPQRPWRPQAVKTKEMNETMRNRKSWCRGKDLQENLDFCCWCCLIEKNWI